MILYLASNYSSHPRMTVFAEKLRNYGHAVTCEWITGVHQADDHEAYARIDLRDIDAAEGLVLFSEDTGPRTRGGKHVEFGYALAKGKAIYLIGELQNVFHYLPEVTQFPDETSFIAGISGLILASKFNVRIENERGEVVFDAHKGHVNWPEDLWRRFGGSAESEDNSTSNGSLDATAQMVLVWNRFWRGHYCSCRLGRPNAVPADHSHLSWRQHLHRRISKSASC